MALLTTLFADPFLTEMDHAMRVMRPSPFSCKLASTSAASGRTSAQTSPPVLPTDIIETATAYELHADTPGMVPEDIKVELHEGVLTVSGQRKVSREEKDPQGKVWRSERSSYSFSRAFTLPENVNTDEISATIDKGVLKVLVPKKDPPAKPEPRRIAVMGA